MRPPLITALAAGLMGCSFAPQQTQQASLAGCMEASGFACSKRAASKMDSKVLHSEVIATKKEEVQYRRANADTKNANSDAVPKGDGSSSAQPEITTSAIAVKPETHQASQVDDRSDPAIKRAKATIAAKMGNPASVEFVEIKRAADANAVVCGFVREKNGAPRPFLYLVPKDEAYIGGYNIATSAYRHICSITL